MLTQEKTKEILLALLGGGLGGGLLGICLIYFFNGPIEWLWYGLSIGGGVSGFTWLIRLFVKKWYSAAFLAGAIVGVIFYVSPFPTSILLVSTIVGILVGGYSSLLSWIFVGEAFNFRKNIIVGALVVFPMVFCRELIGVFIFGTG